jgi:hypothetical protein
MNSEQLHDYRDLFTKYRAYFFPSSEPTEPGSRRRLHDEMMALADNDPEFEKFVVHAEIEYHLQGFNRHALLQKDLDWVLFPTAVWRMKRLAILTRSVLIEKMLKWLNSPLFKYLYRRCHLMEISSMYLQKLEDFSKRKPVEFDNVRLVLLVDLYQHDFWFRNTCDTDKTFRKAMTYWIKEYHRRVENDEMFTAHVLIRKLERFPLGQVGLEPSVEFDETELNLLKQLFHTNPEFQSMLNKETECVRDAVAYLLE